MPAEPITYLYAVSVLPPPQPLSRLSHATICCGESVYVSPSSRITSDSICSVAEKAQHEPQRACGATTGREAGG